MMAPDVLKGRGFSRATKHLNWIAALAAEGTQMVEKTFPRGLKPNNSIAGLMARLKPHPLDSSTAHLVDFISNQLKTRRLGSFRAVRILRIFRPIRPCRAVLHDNGKNVRQRRTRALEELSPPYRFYPTAGLSWKRLKGGRATSALPDARARGNLTARLRRGFPDEAPLPPLQQPVSALEGLHTTLTGTGAANYYWKPTPYRGK